MLLLKTFLLFGICQVCLAGDLSKIFYQQKNNRVSYFYISGTGNKVEICAKEGRHSDLDTHQIRAVFNKSKSCVILDIPISNKDFKYRIYQISERGEVRQLGSDSEILSMAEDTKQFAADFAFTDMPRSPVAMQLRRPADPNPGGHVLHYLLYDLKGWSPKAKTDSLESSHYFYEFKPENWDGKFHCLPIPLISTYFEDRKIGFLSESEFKAIELVEKK